MRQAGMNLPQVKTTMEKAEAMLASQEYAVPSNRVLDEASRTNLSAYDAEYVCLARTMRISLIRVDQQIISLASDIAMSPNDFADNCTRR